MFFAALILSRMRVDAARGATGAANPMESISECEYLTFTCCDRIRISS